MKTNFLKRTCSISLGAMVFFGLMAQAGFNAIQAADGNRGQLSAGDYKFVTDAARGGVTEVELGQLASTNASNPAVRQFAERMVKDHSQANQQLQQIVSQKGATLPSDATMGDTRMVDHLRNLSGTDFDKAYMDHMVKDHKKDVKEFQNEAKKGSDPDVQSFASKTLPVLEEHLNMAQTVDATVKRQSKL